MPTCQRCHRYYSIHAAYCPSCYTDGGHPRIIQAVIELPTVGDTYIDPETGERLTVCYVTPVEGAVTLGLADGSEVDVALGNLRAVSLPDSVAPITAA